MPHWGMKGKRKEQRRETQQLTGQCDGMSVRPACHLGDSNSIFSLMRRPDRLSLKRVPDNILDGKDDHRNIEHITYEVPIVYE